MMGEENEQQQKSKKERECDYLKALFLANGLQSLRGGVHRSFLLQGKPGWKERLDRTQVPCKPCFLCDQAALEKG